MMHTSRTVHTKVNGVDQIFDKNAKRPKGTRKKETQYLFACSTCKARSSNFHLNRNKTFNEAARKKYNRMWPTMWMIENRSREMWKRKHEIVKKVQHTPDCEFAFLHSLCLFLSTFFGNRVEHNKFNVMQMCTKCQVVHLHSEEVFSYSEYFFFCIGVHNKMLIKCECVPCYHSRLAILLK